jgi:hypothetical protein
MRGAFDIQTSGSILFFMFSCRIGGGGGGGVIMHLKGADVSWIWATLAWV